MSISPSKSTKLKALLSYTLNKHYNDAYIKLFHCDRTSYFFLIRGTTCTTLMNLRNVNELAQR